MESGKLHGILGTSSFFLGCSDSNSLAKEKCLPLLVLGMSTAPSRLSHRVAVVVEGALLTFRRLYLLEKRVKEAGLVLDWLRL